MRFKNSSHSLVCLIILVTSLGSCTQGSYKALQQTAYSEDLTKYHTNYDQKILEMEVSDSLANLENENSAEALALSEENLDVDFSESLKDEERLSHLLKIQRDRAKNKGTYNGFSIQVYSGTSREEAEKAKSFVYRVTDEFRPKVEWDEPYYKVKVGQYDERYLAYPIFNKLKKVTSRAIIVPNVFKSSTLNN